MDRIGDEGDDVLMLMLMLTSLFEQDTRGSDRVGDEVLMLISTSGVVREPKGSDRVGNEGDEVSALIPTFTSLVEQEAKAIDQAGDDIFVLISTQEANVSKQEELPPKLRDANDGTTSQVTKKAEKVRS